MGDRAKPLFSVIIPTRDDPALIRAVRSVLGQTVGDLEVIVVDDGSEPPVQPTIDDKRVILERHPAAKGPAAARNTGVSLARGRYIAFLDSDDEYRPERLKRALEGHRLGDVVVVRTGGVDAREGSEPRLLDRPESLLYQTTPHLGMTSVKRGSLQPFNEEYLACQDVDWWIRTVQARIPIAVAEGDLWKWGRSDRRRVLNGPPARLAFSYQLLRDHKSFFEENPRAASFRWRRIAMMEGSEHSFSMAFRAIGRALRAHVYPKVVLDALRLTKSAVTWSVSRTGMECLGSEPLPPVPPERAKHWRPRVRGGDEARIRPKHLMVRLVSRLTTSLPRAVRGRLRRVATLLTGEDFQSCETSWGLFKIPSEDTATLAPYFMEPLESAVVARLVGPGDVAADIGANLGWYTNLLSQRVGSSGEVIAVEPIAELVAKMREQADVNGVGDRVTVLEAAVAENSGPLRLVRQSTLQISHVKARSEAVPRGHIVVVQGATFSDVAGRLTGEISFVKVDVEGLEAVVLGGILDWIGTAGRSPLIMFEVSASNYQRYGFDVVQTLDRLRGIYDLLDIDYRSGCLKLLQLGTRPSGRNVLAVPHAAVDSVFKRVHGVGTAVLG